MGGVALVMVVRGLISKVPFLLLGLAVAEAVTGTLASGSTTAPAGPVASRPSSQPGGPAPLRISPEHMRELTAFLAEYLPDSYEQIQQLQRDNPRQARRHLHRVYWLWWRVRHYPADVRKAAVACYRLNRSIYQTVREVRQAEDPAEKARLTKGLRKLLGEHFDQDQVVKEHRVKFLARQLVELRAKVEQRRKNRPALIQERLTTLLKPPPATRPATSRPARRRYSRRHPPLTPEREAEMTEFLRQNAPDLLKQLERLRKTDPAAADKTLSRVYGLWQRVVRYPPNVQAAILARRRLNVAIDQTVQSVRRTAKQAGREKLIATLRDLLAEQFGHDQVFLEYRLAHLSRELEELEAELATRRRNRSKIIGAWVGKLLAPPVAGEPVRAGVTANAR